MALGRSTFRAARIPLLQASFTTNNRRIPKVGYQVNDGVGSIKTTQSSQSSGLNIGPTTNHWAITLNDDIPLGLTVNSQSAKTTLVLDTLTIQTLDVSTDSGAATVGLEWGPESTQRGVASIGEWRPSPDDGR